VAAPTSTKTGASRSGVTGLDYAKVCCALPDTTISRMTGTESKGCKKQTSSDSWICRPSYETESTCSQLRHVVSSLHYDYEVNGMQRIPEDMRCIRDYLDLTLGRGCTIGDLLTPGSCECSVHEPLGKLSSHKANGHTLHNLMRLNHALYKEVEAALRRFVPILVCLQSFTGRVKWVHPEAFPQPLPFILKETSTIMDTLKHTRGIVLQCALPQLYARDVDVYEARIRALFDWWVANSTPQTRLRVRLWEVATHPIRFNAL